jgi:hypothetical protein
MAYPEFIEGDENGDLVLRMDPAHEFILGNMEGSCKQCHEYGFLFAGAQELLDAAQDFVDKVDDGRARSTRSYARFKAAIAAAKPGN